MGIAKSQSIEMDGSLSGNVLEISPFTTDSPKRTDLLNQVPYNDYNIVTIYP